MLDLRDDVLPAAAHLAGPRARPMLQAALDAVGGQLGTLRTSQVQYRPGSDVVSRYEATVSWHGAPAVRETLLASTTTGGAPTGTLPVTADIGGIEVEVGVWRWPFDPHLPALGSVVTPVHAAERFGLDAPPALEVVAYRPTERAVVRVATPSGRLMYAKVLRPGAVGPLVDRHRALAAAGVPVPAVLDHDDHAGWLLMEALEGDTLRTRLKQSRPPWLPPDELARVLRELRGADVGSVEARNRATDALGHAAMLREVVGAECRAQLDRICDHVDRVITSSADRPNTTVHGDLYEAQLVVGGDVVTGVLDIDDAGVGDPLTDMATMVAHLTYRSITTADESRRREVAAYASCVRHRFQDDVEAGFGLDRRCLDELTGAVMVGLATGPFRVQQRGWRHDVARVLHRAELLLSGT
jgi:aminoglycoside phosphotransferase